MRDGKFLILTANPGSTSTKIGVFLDDKPQLIKSLSHSDEELAPFSGRPILDQLENAPTVQQEAAKKHGKARKVRGMADK